MLQIKEIEYYRTGKYPYAYPNQDWHDIMLKDFTNSYRVNTTASGGTERAKYFASVSYNHVGDIFEGQDVGRGYMPAYAYDRLNIRSNFDFEITKTTKLQLQISPECMDYKPLPSTELLQACEWYISRLCQNLSGETPIKVYEDGVPGSAGWQV
ncbi:MAG: hypothetical protein MZV63_10145 [Marinilabiliales bacterium]|nr:hypothetical protein [Marinilabiliales bacterium]